MARLGPRNQSEPSVDNPVMQSLYEEANAVQQQEEEFGQKLPHRKCQAALFHTQDQRQKAKREGGQHADQDHPRQSPVGRIK